jgi:hypothetical protein
MSSCKRSKSSGDDNPIELINLYIEFNFESNFELYEYINDLISCYIKKETYVDEFVAFLRKISGDNIRKNIKFYGFAIGHGNDLKTCEASSSHNPRTLFPGEISYYSSLPHTSAVVRAVSKGTGIQESLNNARAKNKTTAIRFMKEYDEKKNALASLIEETVGLDEIKPIPSKNVRKFNEISSSTYIDEPVKKDNFLGHITDELDYFDIHHGYEKTNYNQSDSLLQQCTIFEDSNKKLVRPVITISGEGKNYLDMNNPRMFVIPQVIEETRYTIKIKAMLYFLIKLHLINNNVIIDPSIVDYDTMIHFFHDIFQLYKSYGDASYAGYIDFQKTFDVLIRDSFSRELIYKLFGIEIPHTTLGEYNVIDTSVISGVLDVVAYHCCAARFDPEKKALVKSNLVEPKGGTRCRNKRSTRRHRNNRSTRRHRNKRSTRRHRNKRSTRRHS